jgi:hypothetical protein
MHSLDKGQKVAHAVVADERSGKSSGDNLKQSELPVGPMRRDNACGAYFA